jgi:hypothetical protein
MIPEILDYLIGMGLVFVGVGVLVFLLSRVFEEE